MKKTKQICYRVTEDHYVRRKEFFNRIKVETNFDMTEGQIARAIWCMVFEEAKSNESVLMNKLMSYIRRNYI